MGLTRNQETDIREYAIQLEGLGRSDKYIAQVTRIAREIGHDAKPQSTINRLALSRSDATIRQYVTVLKGYGKFIDCKALMALTCPQRRTGRVSEPGALTPIEVEDLVTCPRIPETYRDVWRILSRTGLRPKELWQVQPEMVKKRSDGSFALDLPASLAKSRKGAQMPLDPKTAAALTRGSYARLRGRDRDRLAEALRNDLETCGYDTVDDMGRVRTAYSLRGFFGSRLLAANVPIHICQQLMRHANPATTLKWYARCTPADLDGALQDAFADLAP